MATHHPISPSSPSFLLFLLASLALSTAIPSAVHGHPDGDIVIYWGQNSTEGELINTCASGKFTVVIVAFLSVFGNGNAPQINLAGHCNPFVSQDCYRVGKQVTRCQAMGVKVLLSIGGGAGFYYLNSKEDAKIVADQLWNDFLGGHSSNRPLGDAILDGIDFDIEGGTTLYWDDLARFLTENYKTGNKTYNLTAAPQCPYPDAWMGKAIDTGLFDELYVQFYNNPPCQYDAATDSVENLVNGFKTWTARAPVKKVFMGLPAAPDAAGQGHISPEKLCKRVIPRIKDDPKYGGVMLWARNWDLDTDFSGTILDCVKSSLLKLPHEAI